MTTAAPLPHAVIRQLGCVDYADTLQRMQAFTAARTAATSDEIWLLEHPPVYTLGTNGDRRHLLDAGAVPVVKVDRGGQITYHGPGQLVIYTLVDIVRAGIGVRSLVCKLEQSVVATLADYGISAAGSREAPGVYVAGAKVASIGLRVSRGGCYHGLALNVAPDLAPFTRINPCGYAGLEVTSVARLGGPAEVATVAAALLPRLLDELGLAPATA
ncbi:MAG: lipoyl(octanoyl) transferase LipB [Gammaproteobacteria bacterium]|jgi:lipoyl(octanoyl) transferase|nr:lipoyl(octanoyl) transferase LipB [Gammaproteobacteria bacterium]